MEHHISYLGQRKFFSIHLRHWRKIMASEGTYSKRHFSAKQLLEQWRSEELLMCLPISHHYSIDSFDYELYCFGAMPLIQRLRRISFSADHSLSNEVPPRNWCNTIDMGKVPSRVMINWAHSTGSTVPVPVRRGSYEKNRSWENKLYVGNLKTMQSEGQLEFAIFCIPLAKGSKDVIN